MEAHSPLADCKQLPIGVVAEAVRAGRQAQGAIRAVLATGDAKEGFLANELARLNGELKAIAKAIREAEAQPGHAEPFSCPDGFIVGRISGGRQGRKMRGDRRAGIAASCLQNRSV